MVPTIRIAESLREVFPAPNTRTHKGFFQVVKGNGHFRLKLPVAAVLAGVRALETTERWPRKVGQMEIVDQLSL